MNRGYAHISHPQVDDKIISETNYEIRLHQEALENGAMALVTLYQPSIVLLLSTIVDSIRMELEDFQQQNGKLNNYLPAM